MIFSPVSDLKLLYENSTSPSISIYLPTHRAGGATRQDPIRLKNLLGQAEDQLRERGLRPREIEGLLEPAYGLLRNAPFWRHLADGLALFIANDFIRYYPLSLRFEEQSLVAEQFYLKPLFPLLTGDGSFFILALSQNEVRLLEGTRENVNEIELEDIPASLAETLGNKGREKLLQFHTRTGGGTGKRAAVFFGQGAGEDEVKEDLVRFLRQVDQGLVDLLREERAPLVLAGVEYLLALYRGVNSYPNLHQAGIPGNPEKLSSKKLHQRAWELIEPSFLEEQEETFARYESLAGTGLATNEIEAILTGAHHGRVDRLIVSLGVQLWGKYDLQAGQVNVHAKAEPGDEDLLQLAAIQTILNRGVVYAVPQSAAPGKALLAAIFRY